MDIFKQFDKQQEKSPMTKATISSENKKKSRDNRKAPSKLSNAQRLQADLGRLVSLSN